jgi:formiminotetrahydrofolate cyclodeaminase
VVTDTTVAGYLDELARSSAVPGGGGVSALAGSLGAALGCMVAELTKGKAAYADVDDEVRELLRQATELRRELLRLSDADAEAFAPLSAAYRMPRTTPEEIAERERVLQGALVVAAEAPLATMERSCEAVEVLSRLAEIGSRLAVSDAGCGVVLCRAALSSAALSVFINTRLMADRQRADAINSRARELMSRGHARADEVYDKVEEMLR